MDSQIVMCLTVRESKLWLSRCNNGELKDISITVEERKSSERLRCLSLDGALDVTKRKRIKGKTFVWRGSRQLLDNCFAVQMMFLVQYFAVARGF